MTKPPVPVSAAVPAGRWSRMARLGTLATGVAGGMLAEGARQLAQGKRPVLGNLLLTPANAHRVAEQLSRLRGAAMKVGQLLSMDAGDLLPPEIAAILAKLRSDATPMPMSQVVAVLDAGWGDGWRHQFRQFSFTPVAAASIGQVHFAQLKDGRDVAIKIQYPGVRQSIDSDVDNVAGLLRLSGLLPATLDIAPLMADAKLQLHEEADYLCEGRYMARYGDLLAGESDYAVPALVTELTSASVLTMTRMHGVPIESMTGAPQEDRDRIATLLIGLLLRELFEFQLIQTDPNFANYRYDTATGQVILLDFGATRAYPDALVTQFRTIVRGAIDGDMVAMDTAACAIGYYDAKTAAHHRHAVLTMFTEACEPLRNDGPYDFGQSDLAARIRDAGMALGREPDFWHTPPAAALFLHRKLGGVYLLAARLRARVDVAALGRGLW
ncbi:MAG: putative unusual protein kinase regulating ubiquinone biosynthesis (AarF/ABC1/UbiB family) [Burkholderiaceae bacterium]|jgi:predicted unusual protein kinase regulating ubiquinone biosynthesis (AarF/ABC1/UbiB family)